MYGTNGHLSIFVHSGLHQGDGQGKGSHQRNIVNIQYLQDWP